MKRFLAIVLALIFVSACGGDLEPKPDRVTTPNNGTNGQTGDAGTDSNGATDAGGPSGCFADSDCELGTVCGADAECIVAACDFCTADQVCYQSATNPEGSCSAGETEGGRLPSTGERCEVDTECELGAVCSFDGACVIAECEFCDTSQVCYRSDALPNGSCSAPECSTDDDCSQGTCADGVCQ